MKKYNLLVSFILLSLMLISSCRKESLELVSGTEEVSNDEIKEKGITANSSSSSSCASSLQTANYSVIKTANTVADFPDISNSLLKTLIDSNFDNYGSCIMNVGQPEHPGDGPAVSEEPDNSSESPSNIAPEDVFDYLAQTYRGVPDATATYLTALIQAYNYALNQNINFTPNERMLAIGKALYVLNLGDILVTTNPHGGVDNNIHYLMEAINILAGKRKVTSAVFNAYIATNSSQYVQYPAVHQVGWVGIKAASNNSQLYIAEHDVVINYNAMMLYFSQPDHIFSTEIDYALNTNLFYNSSNQKLYSDTGFNNYVPNGYYLLPINHPSVFERNNFIVLIQNGSIIYAYSGE